MAPATFLDWRQQSTVFAHIGAFNATGATLVGSTGAERLAGGSCPGTCSISSR